jgi:hypothetical protein
MAMIVGEESEQQRMENEAKAKEVADAAAREPLPPLVHSVDDQLGTPKVRCDEHNGKFSLSYETKV